MFNFIENNLGSITLLLAIGTFWMAWSTCEAASASKKIFELEARPCLVFVTPRFDFHQKVMEENQPPRNFALALSIEFKNSGRVPLRYSVTNIQMTFDNRTPENPTYATRGGLIYPGDSGTFSVGEMPYHEAVTKSKRGVIEYTVKYEAIDQKRGFIKTEKMSYILDINNASQQITWHYLKDSEETEL